MNLVVVGPGRVGSAFLRAAAFAGLEAAIVERNGPTDLLRVPHPGLPIVVATRADALEAVISATALENRADLVFLQNGMFLPVLEAARLSDATQGIVYFAATDRTGVVEPGLPTILCGRHAAFLTTLLDRAGIPARVVADRAEFRREQATKMLWILVFGLLGDTWGLPVGEIASAHADQVRALVTELSPVLAAGFGAELDPAAAEAAILAYSRGIPAFRAQVREPGWRNGWAADAARAQGRATPIHDRLLTALAAR